MMDPQSKIAAKRLYWPVLRIGLVTWLLLGQVPPGVASQPEETRDNSAEWGVGEIIMGIMSRRSQVQNMQLDYVIRDHNTDQFFAHRQFIQSQEQQLAQDGTPIPLSFPRDLPSYDADAARRYRLRDDGQRKYFEIHDINDPDDHRLLFKGAYAAGISRLYDAQKNSGTISRAAPDQAIFFPTTTSLLSLEGADLAAYLESDLIDARVTGVFQDEAGRWTVEVTTNRKYFPGGAKSDIEVNNIHVIRIAPDRNFWPTRITHKTILRDMRSDERVEMLESDTHVESFVESGGVYFPKKIKRNDYDYQHSNQGNRQLPTLESEARLETAQEVLYERVSINSDFDEDDFKVVFPSGTKIYDGTLGLGFVAGDDVDAQLVQLAQTMQNGNDAVSAAPIQDSAVEKLSSSAPGTLPTIPATSGAVVSRPRTPLYLIIASAAVFLVAGTILCWQLRRRHSLHKERLDAGLQT